MHGCKNQLNAHSKNEVNPPQKQGKRTREREKNELTLNLFKDNKHAD